MKSFYSLVLVLLLCSMNSFAANFYWVGGNGNWSDFQHHWALNSGGTLFQTTVPSAFDNVIFDNNSFPTSADSLITVDVSVAYMKNLTFTTTHKIKFRYGPTFSSIQIYGSAVFTEGVDMSTPIIYFKSENPGCTITANKSKWQDARLYFDGIGGSWQITDSLTFATDITLLNGTLDVTGKKMSCNHFLSENENVRGWKFANAQVFIYSAYINTNNLSHTWTQSTFTTDELYIENSLNFEVDTIINYSITNNPNYKNISVNVFRCNTSARLIISNCLIAKAYIDYADVSVGETTITEGYLNSLLKLSIGGTLTTSNIIFSGYNCSKPLFLEGNELPFISTIKQTSGVFLFDYALIKNLQATGGAVFQANNSSDLGNNSGVSFPAHQPRTFYWVGNSGDWQDPMHWSLSSGGPSAQICTPEPMDFVILDEQSFQTGGSQSIFSSAPTSNYCKTIDARNLTQNVSLNCSLVISGSAYLSPLMLIASRLTFKTNTTGNEIDYNGASSSNGIILDGGGEWTLLDSIHNTSIEITNGKLYSNGFKIHCDYTITGNFADFSHSTVEAAGIILTQGVFDTAKFIILTKDGVVGVYNPIEEVTALNSSTIVAPKINKLTTYGNLSLGSSYYSSMRIDTLLVQRGTEMQIYATTKIIVDTIILTGSISCQKQTFIASNYIKTPAVISKASGTLRLSDIALLSIKAEGGATFIADNCGDLGGNSGWQINLLLPKNYYWINDGGDWNDETHWSLSSGGAVSGCIPGIQDQVVIDELSFTMPYQVISKVNNIVRISGLKMQNIADNFNMSVALYMYGNLELDAHLMQIYPISFVGNGMSTFKANDFRYSVINTMTDTLKVLDDMYATILNATRGYLDIQEKKITIDRIDWNGSSDSLIVNMKGTVLTSKTSINITLGRMRILSKGSTLSLNASMSSPITMPYVSNNKIIFDRVELIDHELTDDYFIGYSGLSSAYIENLIVISSAKKMWFTISNCEIQNFYLTVSSTVQARANSYIHTFQVYKNIETYSSFKVDYLRLEPGVKMTISSNDTISIIQYLDAIGNSSFPITLAASQSGQQMNLRCASGTICCAYLNLSDANAFGGAQFFAGPSSNNISNNTGWNFSGPCDVLSINANLPGCKGKPITITTTHPPQVNGFLWAGPNGFASNQKNITLPSLNFENEGVYSLLAGGQIRKILLVTESKPDTIITTDQSSIFFESTAISSTNNYTIDWYKDGTLLNGVHTNKLSAPVTGLYYSLFTTPAGCSYQSNTVSYNADPLAIDTPSSSFIILIKPIPVVDYLSIELNHPDLTQVTIYDQIGRILLSEKINHLSSIQLNLTTLLQGAYIIKINTTQQEYFKRFIKQ